MSNKNYLLMIVQLSSFDCESLVFHFILYLRNSCTYSVYEFVCSVCVLLGKKYKQKFPMQLSDHI